MKRAASKLVLLAMVHASGTALAGDYVFSVRGKEIQLKNGGGRRIRTDDPLLAKQVLFRLSYTPTQKKGLRPET